MRDQRIKYPPLCRDAGVRTWQCPCCGHTNRQRTGPGVWRYSCAACRVRYAIGYRFHLIKAQKHRPPRDFMLPQWEDFPKLSLQLADIVDEPFTGGFINAMGPEVEDMPEGEDAEEYTGPNRGK